MELSQPKVLVVTNNPALSYILTAVLEEEEFAVATATDKRTALATLAASEAASTSR